MWICLNDAFLSIVDEKAAATRRTNTDQSMDDVLLVRARIKGDIERVFGPDVRVQRTPNRDYMYRAHVSREDVAHALMAEVFQLDYGNFKDSVREDDRHSAYAAIWGIMYRLQNAKQGVRPQYAMRDLY
jgi:hypothetical protein